MKFRNTLIALAIAAAALFVSPEPARAACGSIPYFFTNGTSIVDATTTNANNAFLIGCATTVDNSQIGVAGIFPSQIIPTTVSNGTFGGSVPFKFNLSTGTQVPLTIQAATTPATDLFDIFNNALSTKFFSIDSQGDTAAAGTLSGVGNITIGGIIFPNQASIGGTTAQVWCSNDQAAPTGLECNVPSASTNGFRYQIGGSVRMQLANDGALLVGPTINSTFQRGPVPPIYGTNGGPFADTSHFSCGAITAVGASTTVTLTNNAAFASGQMSTTNGYIPIILDTSGTATYIGYSSITATTFTFPSTNTHVYVYCAIGA